MCYISFLLCCIQRPWLKMTGFFKISVDLASKYSLLLVTSVSVKYERLLLSGSTGTDTNVTFYLNICISNALWFSSVRESNVSRSAFLSFLFCCPSIRAMFETDPAGPLRKLKQIPLSYQLWNFNVWSYVGSMGLAILICRSLFCARDNQSSQWMICTFGAQGTAIFL